MEQKRNVINIHALDLLCIDRMLKDRRFSNVKQYLDENNIDVNNFKFLKYIAEFKDIEMITYFKINMSADFINCMDTYYNISLLQYYLYMGKTEILNMIYNACGVSTELQNNIQSTLPEIEQTINLNNVCCDANYSIRKQL